ncbi:hypothetical protein HMPREF0293_2695 [Corynebacterium glucuronolyticum ATCC 51866]|uniref:Uncharacterized protein n=1 Tax=Corynebacterium glucuronolyticum ATCC 51866 TaxID=548478 RepID=A0ABM9XL81_9CORY|nr:hypothetical protein HMPREF0293_2695 [Corynebacterium glucuronolyticum ATCC 51866]
MLALPALLAGGGNIVMNPDILASVLPRSPKIPPGEFSSPLGGTI